MLGVCVFKVQFESTDNNGTAVISRLAGGGRGPSVDLDLVAVPFSFFEAGLLSSRKLRDKLRKSLHILGR